MLKVISTLAVIALAATASAQTPAALKTAMTSSTVNLVGATRTYFALASPTAAQDAAYLTAITVQQQAIKAWEDEATTATVVLHRAEQAYQTATSNQ